ncbi:hypothetical protein HMPREF1556_00964 [Porphyromonas sp. oral taxon 278 str. W7784]|nr:hypothetical protein HMPREF1556_00964 [Porphyromonas sp. oral taxon 278 str. W7784]
MLPPPQAPAFSTSLLLHLPSSRIRLLFTRLRTPTFLPKETYPFRTPQKRSTVGRRKNLL